MAQKIIDTKIREAYDTEANWIKYNPVLLSGQLAYSSDKYGKYKVGNGTSTWSQLQYVTLNWGDIGGKPSSFAPTTHNHTISQITDIGNASVKYATTAGSANTTSQIIDPSDKHGINISYVDEVNTTSWIPVYKDRNHMSTISTNNLRNAIGAAQASHSHNNYLPLSGGIVPNLNAILADIKTNDNITPRVASIATSPFARFYWHDHFAFLNSHTIVNHQVMLNGQSSWVDNNLNLTSLFMQKEHIDCTILEKSQLARRFTIKCNSFSYCAIEWIEMGVAYSDPFSKFEVLLEQSTDNVKWTTIHQSLMTDKNAFLRAEIGGQCTYLRFTFTKKTNVTTGSVRLTCIKGLTYRKGDQGLGIEYETPFDWDAYRNIYPHRNISTDLGTSNRKWRNVYAENFIGNVQGNVQGKSTSSDYLHVHDTRNENPMPNDKGFRKQAISFDFKSSSAIGNPIANGYYFTGLMSFAPWSETSGGNGYQMAFGYSNATTPRLSIRTADLSATTWGAWYKIYTSADKPTLSELGAAASNHTHSDYATTTNLNLANQRIDAHEKELGVHKTLIDGKAPSNHSHNTIRDFKDGEDISISTSILVTPNMGSIFDFIISGTQYGANQLVTMSSNQLGRCHAHTISQITDFPNIKAITNSQIDSLASL